MPNYLEICGNFGIVEISEKLVLCQIINQQPTERQYFFLFCSNSFCYNSSELVLQWESYRQIDKYKMLHCRMSERSKSVDCWSHTELQQTDDLAELAQLANPGSELRSQLTAMHLKLQLHVKLKCNIPTYNIYI